jgi:16S rRNA (cytidine1402-2'-O)-methyltransferase
VSRELSKLYEENVRGTVIEVKSHFENNILKGEFVICVGGLIEDKATKKKDKYGIKENHD